MPQGSESTETEIGIETVTTLLSLETLGVSKTVPTILVLPSALFLEQDTRPATPRTPNPLARAAAVQNKKWRAVDALPIAVPHDPGACRIRPRPHLHPLTGSLRSTSRLSVVVTIPFPQIALGMTVVTVALRTASERIEVARETGTGRSAIIRIRIATNERKSAGVLSRVKRSNSRSRKVGKISSGTQTDKISFNF